MSMKGIMTLHSTMYLFLRRASLSCICLLSLYIPQCIYFYFLRICYFCNNASLHSTMYLFLRGCNEKKKLPLDFTFHNVSISTKARANGCTTRNPTLHSTMYLFLPGRICFLIKGEYLYIPQCIYFYVFIIKRKKLCKCLYIPQCIYFYLVFPPQMGQSTHLYIPQCIYFYKSRLLIAPGQFSPLHSTMYLFLRSAVQPKE